MNCLAVTIILYIAVVVGVIVMKPKIIFDNPNIYGKFGLKTTNVDNKTMVPLWLIMFVFAMMLYFVVVRLFDES